MMYMLIINNAKSFNILRIDVVNSCQYYQTL